jgi:hypothetical protein
VPSAKIVRARLGKFSGNIGRTELTTSAIDTESSEGSSAKEQISNQERFHVRLN